MRILITTTCLKVPMQTFDLEPFTLRPPPTESKHHFSLNLLCQNNTLKISVFVVQVFHRRARLVTATTSVKMYTEAKPIYTDPAASVASHVVRENVGFAKRQ